MTNADVVAMVKAGLSDDVVLTAIRQAADRSFDLSPTSLIELKNGNVSDAVIRGMQEVGTASTAASREVENLSGFYWREKRAGDRPPFGDYLILRKEGQFLLVDVQLTVARERQGLPRQDDKGTFAVLGNLITFSKEAPGISPHLSTVSRLEPGRIIEPNGTVWSMRDASPAAKTAAPSQAPAPVAPCEGIQNMGLYKNEVFSREMGGGVIEWLAKIRNNTSTSKIVTIGWRDQYGQQKTSRVQIDAGQISTLRLDMTQARPIPPVANLRVVECQ